MYELQQLILKDEEQNINTKRAVKSIADAKATKAILKESKYSTKISSIVSGGAFELGNKK